MPIKKKSGTQRRFEEDVEQHNVERDKHADHREAEQSSQVEFVDALVDRVPRDQHRRHHQDCGEDDEPNIHAVDADVELHAPSLGRPSLSTRGRC